jgi:PhnB protein
MQMNPYLSFDGRCEEAFHFYHQCLGAEPGGIYRYADSPMAGQVPPDWQDKVMHASLTLAGQVLMGGDLAAKDYQQPQGFSLALQLQDTAEAEREGNPVRDSSFDASKMAGPSSGQF